MRLSAKSASFPRDVMFHPVFSATYVSNFSPRCFAKDNFGKESSSIGFQTKTFAFPQLILVFLTELTSRKEIAWRKIIQRTIQTVQ